MHNKFIRFVLNKGGYCDFKKTQYLGMVEEGFLFHNYLVSKDGGLPIPIASSGIIPQQQGGKKMVLTMPTDPESAKKILIDFVKNTHAILGNQTWKAIGFAVATLFSDKIFDRFGFFPELFLWGSHGTGKSTLAMWLSALFGLHRALVPFNINSTQKAIQRTAQKYKNCPITMNEFRSSDANIGLLTAFFDRQSYGRAQKDNSLEILQGQINATFIVISTLNLVGTKAEDVQSRIITLHYGEVARNAIAANWLTENSDQFSFFVPYVMAAMRQVDLAKEIKRAIKETRESITGAYEDRILETHTILWECYRLFLSLFGDEFSTEEYCDVDIAKEIERQTSITKDSDLGLTFLKIAIALVRNDRVKPEIAKITNLVQKDDESEKDFKTRLGKFDSFIKVGAETLVFSLSDILPFVKAQGKQAETLVADEKTIANALKGLGCEKKISTELTNTRKNIWFYVIPETIE
jgi:hypothetical protein